MPKRYSSRELIALVRDAGWFFVSQSGSHQKFKHPTKQGIIVIPHPKKDIPAGTTASILRQAGLD